jgi:hypothetical protein
VQLRQANTQRTCDSERFQTNFRPAENCLDWHSERNHGPFGTPGGLEGPFHRAMKARTCGKGPSQGPCTACARVCNDSEGCCFGSSRSQLYVECGGCDDPIHQLSTIEYCGRTKTTQRTTVVATFFRMSATVAERTDECKRQKHKAAKRKGTTSTARSS